MAEGYAALTEKEKQTLRLIVRGHDAKSTARHLGLSVHTINERLRDARRKLSVSSSREAARMVLAEEGETPDSLGDKQLGEEESRGPMAGPDHSRAALRRRLVIVAGVLIMTLVIAVLALSALSPAGTQNASAGYLAKHQAPADSAQAQANKAALDWLALVDAGDWQASLAAAGTTFRAMNTLKMWRDASLQAREPLGATQSREFISVDYVAAPPHGYTIVRFRAQFAKRGTAIERVTLQREESGLKVVGYTITDESADGK